MPNKQHIDGFENLHRKLIELGGFDGGKVLRSATLQATTPILRVARQRIPTNDRDYLQRTHKGRLVAPGFAKRNIARKTYLSKDKSFARTSVGVRSEAFYAVQFVELGTSKQRPQRWLRGAHRATRAEQIDKMRGVLKKKIDEIVKKRSAR